MSKHVFGLDDASGPQDKWEDTIQDRFSVAIPSVAVGFAQVCKLHCFYLYYNTILRAVCKTVLHMGLPGSDTRNELRVSELSARDHAFPKNERVSGWTFREWTNTEQTALIATYVVVQRECGERMLKRERASCGPTDLDIGIICRMFHLGGIYISRDNFLNFSCLARLAEQIVLKDSQQFWPLDHRGEIVI